MARAEGLGAVFLTQQGGVRRVRDLVSAIGGERGHPVLGGGPAIDRLQ
jgi:hypothetical protein